MSQNILSPGLLHSNLYPLLPSSSIILFPTCPLSSSIVVFLPILLPPAPAPAPAATLLLASTHRSIVSDISLVDCVQMRCGIDRGGIRDPRISGCSGKKFAMVVGWTHISISICKNNEVCYDRLMGGRRKF
eukprot:768553-Hanusia_phi.AAC.5